jgi:hydroxyethylthiazole kinase
VCPSLAQAAVERSRRVRQRAPLVHQITNFVVMNFTANVTLALGAQPVMAHAIDEVEEMVTLASALVLNIGTLERAWIDAMVLAGAAANRKGIPVVLDPVGAGATQLRTDAARRILAEVDVAVVRGNAGEILALAGDTGKVRAWTRSPSRRPHARQPGSWRSHARSSWPLPARWTW